VLLWTAWFPALRNTKTFDPPDDLEDGDLEDEHSEQTLQEKTT